MAAKSHKSNLEDNLKWNVLHPNVIKSMGSFIEDLRQITAGEKDQTP